MRRSTARVRPSFYHLMKLHCVPNKVPSTVKWDENKLLFIYDREGFHVLSQDGKIIEKSTFA